MRCSLLGIGLLVLSLVTGAELFAQDKPAGKKEEVCKLELTEEQINQPAKRDLDVEEAEPKEFQLSQANPLLIEQKYQATIQLRLSGFDESQGRGLRSSVASAELERVEKDPSVIVGGRHFVLLSFGLPFNVTRDEKASLKGKIAQIPEERMPGQEERETLTGPAADTLVNIHYQESNLRGFAAFGRTSEEAERRVRAMLTVLDEGLFRPAQLARWKEHQAACAKLPELEKKLVEAQAKAQEVYTEVEKYADFSPDLLTSIRAQQIQLEVDMVGVKARLETCEKLLAKGPSSDENKKRLEDLKIAAEVEFAGLEAKHAKSGEIIGKIKKKAELQREYQVALGPVNSAKAKLREQQELIRRLELQTALYSKPEVVDNKIVIRPIEWVK